MLESDSEDDVPLGSLRGRGRSQSVRRSSRGSRGSSRGSRRGVNPRIIEDYPPDGWSTTMPQSPDLSFTSSTGATALADECNTALNFFLLVLSGVDFWEIIVENTNAFAASKG